jgi:hypothetical protein
VNAWIQHPNAKPNQYVDPDAPEISAMPQSVPGSSQTFNLPTFDYSGYQHPYEASYYTTSFFNPTPPFDPQSGYNSKEDLFQQLYYQSMYNFHNVKNIET